MASMNAEGDNFYDLNVKPHGFPAPIASTPGRPGFVGISLPNTASILLDIYDYDV